MINRELKLAIAKGYLWDCAQELLGKLGWKFSDNIDESRQLWTYEKTQNIKILKVRSWDVPTYVTEGGVDLGIVGKDVLIEQKPAICELMDLGFGGCKLVIAGPRNIQINQLNNHQRVASKYYHSTVSYFQKKGILIHPIKLAGAIELAPLSGLSDLICDLTATGTTLKDNGLHIIDTVYESTARLIANPIGYRIHHRRIIELIQAIKHVT